MSGEIKVTFAEIAQAASTISAQSREVDALLDELKAEVQKTLGGYTGEGADTYQASQQKWDIAAEDLNKVLAAIGTAVQSAGDAYQEAEKRNVSRW